LTFLGRAVTGVHTAVTARFSGATDLKLAFALTRTALPVTIYIVEKDLNKEESAIVL